MGSTALATKDSKELSTRRRQPMAKRLAVHDCIEQDVRNSFAAVIEATPEVDELVGMKAAHAAAEAFHKAIGQQILDEQIEGDMALNAALEAARAGKQSSGVGLVGGAATELDRSTPQNAAPGQ